MTLVENRHDSAARKRRFFLRKLNEKSDTHERNHRDFLASAANFPFAEKVFGWFSFWPVRHVQFRMVENADELKRASRLVYNEYLKSGYISPNPSKHKFSVYQLHPRTRTFVAIAKGEHILGTLTLVEDSPLGLPMDQIYREDLNIFRNAGKSLAECTMLAIDRNLTNTVLGNSNFIRISLIMHFLKAVFSYVRFETNISDLVACYHPRHDVLYNFLQFKLFGNFKQHSEVNGNPAIARHLDISETQNAARKHIAYKLFFKDSKKSSTPNKPLSFSESAVQALFNQHPEVFLAATPKQLDYLQQLHPNFEPEHRLFIGTH